MSEPTTCGDLGLSPRQREIAQLAATLSYTRIAKHLGVSYHTVLSHVREIVRKAGLPGETPQDTMARCRNEGRAAR